MTVAELVWDMDGTLLDSTVVVPAAFVRAVARLGGQPVSPAQAVAAYPVGTPEAILAHLVGRPLGPHETDFYYQELHGAQVAAYPGIVETLAALRARGRAVAVFTGASTRGARMLLDAAGLAVDVLVGGDHVRRPKPAGDGVLLAAERLRVAPGAVAYIGDSPLDLRAAASAGSVGAAAAWGHLYDAQEPADRTLVRPEAALDLLG